MCRTCVKCRSVFSMHRVQLPCVIEYLFCIPEAVLWDCCSFNYSLILKDQRSLPQSTPCISLGKKSALVRTLVDIYASAGVYVNKDTQRLWFGL